MLYVQLANSNKNVVLLISRDKGHVQLANDQPFSYDHILQLDYEDHDSQNLILLVDCLKGVQKMYLSKDFLLKDSCGPKSFRLAIEQSNNLITTLRPYIQGHVSLKDC